MMNTRKIAAYGSLPLVFIVGAIVMFVKGNLTGGLAFMFALALFGVGGSVFHGYLKKSPRLKRLDAWLEGMPQPARTPEVSEVAKEFDSMLEKQVDAEQKTKEVAGISAKISKKIAEFRAYVKTFSPKERRKAVQAEQAKAVEDIKEKVMKTGEGVFMHMETSKDRLAEAINDLHAEVTTALKMTEGPKGSKKRKKDLAKLEKMLHGHVDSYSKTLEGKKNEKTIARLKNLEKILEIAMSDDSDRNMDKRLFKEVGDAESQLRYLEQLRGRIQGTVAKVQEIIKPDWRDKRYEDMQTQLDLIDKAVEQVIPAAKEHHRIAMAAFKRVREFHDLVIGAKQSKLMEIEAVHAAQAELARQKAEADKRNIDDLSTRLTASEKENKELKEKVATLERNLGDVNATLARWQADLEKAHKIAKDSNLDEVVINMLVNNVNEQEDLLTKLVKLLVEKETLNVKETARANDAESQLRSARDRIVGLEKAVEELTKAKEALESERRTLLDNKEALEKENRKLITDLNKLAPEIKESVTAELKGEYEDQIKEKTERIEDINRQIIEAIAENETLEQELADTQSKLGEARTELGSIQENVIAIDREARQAKADLEKTREELTQVTYEKDKQAGELQKKEEELQSLITKTDKEIKRLTEELRQLQRNYDDEHKEAERWFEETHKALDRAVTAEQRMQAFRKARDELQGKIKGLQARDKAFTIALENKKEALTKAQRSAREWKDRYNREAEPAKLAAAEFEIEYNRIKRLLVEERDNVSRLELELEQAKRLPPEEKDAEGEDVLQKEINRQRAQITALEREQGEIDNARAAAVRRGNTAVERAAQLEERNRELADELKRTKAEIGRRVTEATGASDNLQEKVDELGGRLSEKERRIEQLNSTEAGLKEELRKINGQLTAARAKSAYAERNQALAEEQAKTIGALEEELEEKIAEITDIAGARDELIKDLGRLEKESMLAVVRIEGEKNAAALEATQYKNESLSLREQINILNDDVVPRLRTRVSELNKRVGELEPSAQRMPGVQNELEAEREKLGTREKELNELRQRFQELETRNKELTEQNNQFRGQIQTLMDRAEEAARQAEIEAEKSAKEERQQQFLKVKRLVHDKVNALILEQDELDPAETLRRMDELVAYAEDVKAKPAHAFLTDVERMEIDNLVQMVTDDRDYYERKLQERASPPPVPLEAQPPKVIAIGDVHGDFHRLKNVLMKAGVMGADFKWKIKKDSKTQVIMLGDYIDRGEHSFKVLNLLYHLKEQAGDQLKLLIGNHEAMFLGAFDWPGFDKKLIGSNKMLADYASQKVQFDEMVKQKGRVNMAQRDALLKTMGPDFRSTYLRLEFLKGSWWQNDWLKRNEDGTEAGPGQSVTLKALGITDKELMDGDGSAMTNATYVDADTKQKTPIRNYLKWLRDNLHVYHYMGDEQILFVHAGIPYKVPNPEAMDSKRHGSFESYIFGGDLMNMMTMIENAIRNRNVQLWMAFSEGSPIFACNPSNRSLEWDALPQFNEGMIKSVFKFNAVVFGHSQGAPHEEQYSVEYQGKARRKYNIDFGMSSAYNKSYGGWLTVNADRTITVNVLDNQNNVRKYKYDYLEEKAGEDADQDEEVTTVTPRPTKA